MRSARVWKRLIGVDDRTVIEDLEFEDDDEAVVVHVRPRRPKRRRCGRCEKPAPGYDDGEGRRRWRGLDLGTVKVVLEADAPRVACFEHGVTVAWVPWARHGSGFTRDFEEQAAWLACHASKLAITQLLRIAWVTVGRIIARVVAERGAGVDPLEGLTRIGIDEISYVRGHKYLTVVVDHDSGRLVWIKPGRSKKTVAAFFDALGEARCAKIRLVSADAAEWISPVVAKRCPGAVRCMDPFHVCQWATNALDDVRRETWNAARRAGQKAVAKELKGARYALWKNPEDLTERQQAKLADIAATNKRLYRAYLLKEQLRMVFHQDTPEAAISLLERWLAWASRSQIPAFVKLARTVRKHKVAIYAAVAHGLTNARVESLNQKLRLLIRKAFGFRSADALIGMAWLAHGGLCPPLPGRS
ncbi:MAG TPA: ISL3 family transposase [Actinomycetes bacterium]|nr:ISL3 family transposase [Actinomycetes bacterium]